MSLAEEVGVPPMLVERFSAGRTRHDTLRAITKVVVEYDEIVKIHDAIAV
jgi:hypothetical protein